VPSATPAIAARGERKVAVLMFADLTGYTELCRRLDAEDVAATVRPVMLAMKRLVEEEGGVVPSIAGDGFMAVFGVPQALPDAGQRALRSAQAVRDLVAESNRSARPFRIPDVHVGIAAGEVLVVPSDEAAGWSLVGNAVNLASRLCDAAGPDEVLVDAAVRELLGDVAVDAERRQVVVGGVSDAHDVWSITRQRRERPAASRPTPFVNRTDAIAQLDAAAEEVAALNVSRMVLVTGESGIGKSRLIQHWLEERGARHAWIWCGTSTGTSAIGRLAEEVGALVPPADESMRHLRTAIGGDTSNLRPDPFPAVVAATRQLLEHAAEHEPLTIVLDDAHVADSSLLTFIQDLRDRPVRGRLLVVASWRSDEVIPLWSPDVHLEPLTDADTARLLSDTLGATPPAVVEGAVIQRVGGHPLMAVQSAAYLLESGVVTVAGNRCELRQPDAVEILPTSLRLFVAARIDRLDADQKAALNELSTFGEHVDRSTVQRLCGAHILAATSDLVDRGLLREAGNGWRFAHGLVQQVAYSSLPRSVRAELHRRQWQLLPADQTGPRLYHARRWSECAPSTDPEHALAAAAAALRAADAHARVLFATQAAAAHGVVREVSAVLEDNKHRFPVDAGRLYGTTSRSLLEMGRFEEALHAADMALELTGSAGADGRERLPAMLARGHALSRLRRFQAARQVLDDALRLAEQLDDAVARGQTLRLLGDTWRHTSFSDFIALTEQAYEALDAAGDTSGATECACILAYLRSVSTTASFRRWRDLAAAAVTDDDLRGRLWLSRADLEAAGVRDEHEAALAAAGEAVRLGELLGAVDGVADGLAGVVRAATALGRLPEAIAAYEQLRDLAITSGNPRMRVVASAEGALPLLRHGQLAAALQEQAAATTAVTGFGPSEIASVYLTCAMLARDRGRWVEASQHIQQVSDVSSAAGLGLDLLSLRLLEAVVHAELSRPPTPDYLDRLVADCEQAEAPRLAARATALVDQLRIRNGAEIVPTPPGAAGSFEEAACRADTAAMLADRSGDGSAAWSLAAQMWGRLGITIWRARAQARSGDRAGAEQTLGLLDADDDARTWALQD
jgi:class 3 adenylate cyclase/tetratricopeptide (TPR) repeat protein